MDEPTPASERTPAPLPPPEPSVLLDDAGEFSLIDPMPVPLPDDF